MTDEILEVAIVGYGPTGQMMAALLGRRGHKVTAFERHISLYPLPRASTIDFEIARNLQSIGQMDRYLDVSAEAATKYHWINGDGEPLMTIDWDRAEINGYLHTYIGFQPCLEDCMSDAASECGFVEVYRGWDINRISHRPDGLISLRAAEYVLGEEGRRVATGVTREFLARYVIAADGGSSYVRSALGMELEDWGFRSDWLVVDCKIKRQLADKTTVFGDKVVKFDNELIQLCDPKRPQYFGPLGKGGRRFEFAVMPGETIADMEQPQRAWDLLGETWGVTSDDLEIYRQVVYTFNSFLAKTWRQGNVFLVGDAAHGMPPYLGQGLCSGLRDAMNLAWKLDFVLNGLARPSLLETYEVERAGNVRYYIESSLAVGAVSCTFDVEAAAERDAAFAAGAAGAPAEPPGLVDGLLLLDPGGAVIRPAGLLGPQSTVSYRGVTGRLDDLTGTTSFAVLAYGVDPRRILRAEQLSYLDKLGADLVQIGPADTTDDRIAADLTGAYGEYFQTRKLTAIVVRPDFYVFGAAPAAVDLSAVIDALMAKLPLAAGARTRATVAVGVGGGA